MAVPDYQAFLLPFLQLLEDGKEHLLRNIYETLADRLQLSEDDRQQMLPSGQQPTYMNRIGWARTHLKKSCLLDAPKRGQFVITDRGREFLAENPKILTANTLKLFPEYQVFSQGNAKSNSTVAPAIVMDTDRTPEEILQDAYLTLRSEVADEIIQLLKSSSPVFFERVVVDLLVSMGYGGSRKATGKAIGGRKDARDYVTRIEKKIVLIDGEMLAE